MTICWTSSRTRNPKNGCSWAVLDRDYLTVPADQIKDIKPMMTMIGGRAPLWKRDGCCINSLESRTVERPELSRSRDEDRNKIQQASVQRKRRRNGIDKSDHVGRAVVTDRGHSHFSAAGHIN